MSMTRKTIISLWGSSGVGKSALYQLMRGGQAHLVEVPLLREAMAAGFAEFDRATALLVRAEGRPPLEPVIRQAIGDKAFLVSDLGILQEEMAAECPDYRTVVCCLFVYPWLVEARRNIRYRFHPTEPSRQKTDGVLPDRALVDYVAQTLIGDLGVETILVDASDYPLRPMTVEEAYAMVDSQPSPVQLPPVESLYQQCLWIAGELHGSQVPDRQQFERQRLDSILPPDLTGKSILDIGASEGGMSYEALHRGALYATAVEQRQAQVELMRHIRTARQLPMTVCHLDVRQGRLPPLAVHFTETRYDLTLLLNVLHHFEDPLPLLDEALDLSERLILETAFGLGKVPYKAGWDPYPNATHLPPEWVRRVAEGKGFRLAAIEVSDMCPGQRLIYRLERVLPTTPD